ncbi:hypothetical protein Aple_081380 [Acrocarpospora pleiomorpha]|uniref:Uncharacterized protein n=1 Tax=Acrocarpospora pleiomorpha TaxID=90975 RepID=A0A5M3XZ58_9ACTN|nr:hypothetical protein [Acrocarpospora pleiomorpha]GES25239.1 hypothetical protein Aple_081380 [Acrocarpospora pleiomorpha]
MKIRIVGLPDAADHAVELLGQVFDVIEVSAPYPSRGTGRNVRIYVEVRMR